MSHLIARTKRRISAWPSVARQEREGYYPSLDDYIVTMRSVSETKPLSLNALYELDAQLDSAYYPNTLLMSIPMRNRLLRILQNRVVRFKLGNKRVRVHIKNGRIKKVTMGHGG